MPNNPYTVIEDGVTDLALDVLAVGESNARAIIKILKQLEKDLIKQIIDIDPNGVKWQFYRIRRLENLLSQARSLIRTYYTQIYALNRNQSLLIASASATQITAVLGAAVTPVLFEPVLAEAVLIALVDETLFQGNTLRDWWRAQDSRTVRNYMSAVQRSVLAGETVERTARAIRDTLQISQRHAASLARTGAMNVNNSAVIGTYANNDDIIKGIRWLSTLDTRTTQICRTLDGKRWKLSTGSPGQYALYKPVGHSLRFPGPTAHWSCRSTQLSWLKTPQELGIHVNDVPEDTRAALDGPVPESTNYNDWLKRQGRARQEEVLGVSKRKLWIENKLTQAQLYDVRHNKPFTVEQLQRKYGK